MCAKPVVQRTKSFRITSDLWDALEAYAEKNGRNLSQELRLAVKEYLERRGIDWRQRKD